MPQPMPILLLDLGSELRGGQKQVYYLARALAAEPDFLPLTACPAGSPLAELMRGEGLTVLELPGRGIANPRLLLTLHHALKQEDVIHTHDANAATVGALFKWLSPRLKLVHSRRVSYPPRTGLRLQKYRMADAVVGVSQEIADGMIAAGIPAERVYAIHSGIDASLYRPRESHAGPFLFQSIGACTPQKGYTILVQAMARLRELTTTPWRVRIIGEGPLREPLLAEAEQRGVKHLLDMPGRRDSREVLPECDALVVPSVDGEGSSGAIKEGWVTGVPVLCSDLPSNTELVQHEHNGLLSRAGDPESLAQSMRRCLEQPELRSTLSREGTRSVAEYTDTRMAFRYMQLYRQLLERRKP